MVYVIESCSLRNHKEECIVVKNSSLAIEEMTNIVGALSNLYYFSKDEEFSPPSELLNILCKNLGCKERKHKYRGELESIQVRIQPPMLHTTFVLRDELVIWIDVREAMDYTRGRMWNILNTYLEEDDIKNIEEQWRG